MRNRLEQVWNNPTYRRYYFWVDLALAAVLVGFIVDWALFG